MPNAGPGTAGVSRIDAHLGKWWDRASQRFAHRQYKSTSDLKATWRSVWLDRFCSDGRCNGATFTEYGIGAGLLGQLLLTEYGAKHYAGIDVSNKSLEASRARLEKSSISRERFSLHGVSVPFDQLGSRVFISQAVIQHFPSLNYTLAFLRRVNQCGAEYLMLQLRAGASDSKKVVIPRLKHPGGFVEGAVRNATRMTTEELTRSLDRYVIEWHNQSRFSYDFHSFRRRNV